MENLVYQNVWGDDTVCYKLAILRTSRADLYNLLRRLIWDGQICTIRLKSLTAPTVQAFQGIPETPPTKISRIVAQYNDFPTESELGSFCTRAQVISCVEPDVACVEINRAYDLISRTIVREQILVILV